MTRVRQLAVTFLLVACACGAPESDSGAPGLAPVDAGPSAGPPAVETTVVELSDVAVVISASGTLEARRITEIVPEVQGLLVEVPVDVGDEVAAGDPLLRIDPQPFEMAVREARAGVSLARAEASHAAEEQERIVSLAKREAVSDQRQDELRTQAAVADALVEQARARLARVELDLARTVVRAPYAGSIVERRAHEGAMAGASPVLVIQETGALEAVLDIPEATPAQVRSGDEVRLHVEGLPEPIVASVHSVSRRVDPDTRTYEVRAAVPNPDATLKAGSYVQAEVAPSPGAPAPVVPRAALLMRDGRTYVFRVDGDRVEQVAVRIGRMNRERATVLTGVAAGERVVVGDAVARLVDGARIGVSDEHSSVSTAATTGAVTGVVP